MAGITLEQAQNHLNSWLDADFSCSQGKSYKIGSRSLSRADVSEIKERIQYWSNEVSRLESGRKKGIRAFRFVPRDL